MAEIRESVLARRLAPYIVRYIQSATAGLEVQAPQAGKVGRHDLGGSLHTGTVRNDQGPQFVLLNGSRPLQADWNFNSGVSIDGMDPSAHVVNPNAHHNRQHNITSSSDHVANGPQYSVLGMATANALGMLPSTTNAYLSPSQILRANSSGKVTVNGLNANTIGAAQTNISIIPAGDIVLDPGGSDVLPGGSIEDDLGDYNRMWRTIFAAELYVQTLVAQDVISTIGGRILVTPTAELTRQIIPGSNTIYINRNGFFFGDFVIMMAAPGGIPQFEAMKIVSGAIDVGNDEWGYTVQRNLDGTGANTWQPGDAVASIGGPVGSGYIELTSTRTVHNHLGPNITVYTRTGTTQWNQVKPTTAMGNLESFVDYGSHEEGFAVGNDLTKDQFTGFKGATVDRTNGLRLFSTAIEAYDGSTKTLRIEPHGDFLIGSNVNNPGTTTLAVFSKSQGYDGQSMAAGDIIMRAANGATRIDQDGITIEVDDTDVYTSIYEPRAVTWKIGTSKTAKIWGYHHSSRYALQLEAASIASNQPGRVYLRASDAGANPIGEFAYPTLSVESAAGGSSRVTLTANIIDLSHGSQGSGGRVIVTGIMDFTNMPSTASGLSSGTLYHDGSGFVKIVL